MRQIPSRSVDIVITDVPYLVNYRPRDGRRCLNDDDARWLQPAFQELQRVLKADSFCVCFYGWPWIDRFMQVWKACGFRPVSHLAWVKGYPSREGYMKSFHEVGFLLAKGKPAKPLEPLSDVLPWDYSGNKLHPNQKPVMAIKPLIETYSQPGDVVLDPFAGSGTTGVGARACGRQFILIEKDPSVFRLAQQRLDTFEPA
jgi:site-specific DNA-methyltransferase (adenine-specific)